MHIQNTPKELFVRTDNFYVQTCFLFPKLTKNMHTQFLFLVFIIVVCYGMVIANNVPNFPC